MGPILQRTFGVLQRNLVLFLLLGILTTIPVVLLQWLLFPTVAVDRSWFDPTSILFGVAQTIFQMVLQAGIAHGMNLDLNDQRPSFADSLGIMARLFVPVIAIGFLWSIGVTIGFVLLVIPGIVLAVSWAVVVPVQVVERTGVIGSFTRSRELTRGFRMNIILFLLIVVLALIPLGLGLQVLVANLADMSLAEYVARVPPGGPLKLIATGLLTPITSTVWACAVAAIYFELRLAKGGFVAEHTAEVFD